MKPIKHVLLAALTLAALSAGVWAEDSASGKPAANSAAPAAATTPAPAAPITAADVQSLARDLFRPESIALTVLGNLGDLAVDRKALAC